MNVGQALEEIGLSKQEGKVYTTTLKLGLAKASQIAQKSGIQRGGAYYILNLLKEKGFISEIIKSGVKYYNAVSPERINQLIEDERDKKKDALKIALPELKELQDTAIKQPKIEMYEGYEGFKTMFTKLLEKPNQQFRCYLSSKILDYLPHFHEHFRKRRAKKNIHIKTITERTELLAKIKKLDSKELRETRFDDSLFKDSEILYYILEEGIVIIKANKKEQLGIYIQEENLAQLHKHIFDRLWKKAKK